MGTDSFFHHCLCFISQELYQLCRRPGQQEPPVGQWPLLKSTGCRAGVTPKSHPMLGPTGWARSTSACDQILVKKMRGGSLLKGSWRGGVQLLVTTICGTSLVAQGLRMILPMQETRV